MIVRHARAGDADALIALGRAMREECLARFPEIDAECVRDWLSAAERRPAQLLVAVAEEGGEPVGFVTAVVGDWAFSRERRAACDLLYVRPSSRGGVAASALVGAFADWATRNGARTLVMGTTTGVAPERTGRLFERLGFAPVGTLHVRSIH
jgi:GNAT superfamily N-acetyltransferase